MRESKAIALKDQLVAVTITCPEASSAKEINKKLPGVAADWCMSSSHEPHPTCSPAIYHCDVIHNKLPAFEWGLVHTTMDGYGLAK